MACWCYVNSAPHTIMSKHFTARSKALDLFGKIKLVPYIMQEGNIKLLK